MNREGKLRKAVPGASDETLAVLAALPMAQVDLIAGLARQAGRDALAADRARKRQRKEDDRVNGNHDESSFTRRNLAVIASQGERARSGNLDALEGLGQVRRSIDTVIGRAVASCRAEGISDKVIGEALGVTKQAVQSRWSRQGTLSGGDQAG